MKQRIIYLTATIFLLSACGGQTTKEKEAYEDVFEIIENLPEILKEAEETVVEESTDVLTGSLNISTDEGDVTNTNWYGDRASTIFMDTNFSLQACSDSDCSKKLLLNISGSELHSQTLPMTLKSSLLDEFNGSITFVDEDKTEYVTRDGIFELTSLSESHVAISYKGDAFKGIGKDGVSIPVTIELEFDFNFVSTDLRGAI